MKNKNLKIIIIVSIVIPSLILISTVGLDADRNDFPASHFILETITVESFPIGISINPITNIVYVANNHSDTVSVIDGKTNVIVKEIPVDNTPWGIDVDSENNLVYITSYFSNTISIIDETQNGLITTLKIDKPWGIDVDSETGYVFVVNRDSTNISILKDNKIQNLAINETHIRISPFDISYNEKTNLLYVTNSSLISIIDLATNKILDPISVGNNLAGITINPETNTVYASDIVNDVLYIIDGNTNALKEELKVGDHPISVEINPITNTIYVVNEYSNSISVISN